MWITITMVNLLSGIFYSFQQDANLRMGELFIESEHKSLNIHQQLPLEINIHYARPIEGKRKEKNKIHLSNH